MKTKQIIITSLLTILTLALFAINFFTNKFILRADSVYEIYLDGKVVGFIDDEERLYDMINEEQKEIKNKFNVKNVYPPVNFQIVKTNSYKEVVSPVEKVYEQISSLGTFTIEGYIVTIHYDQDNEENKKEDVTINLLDKKVFDDAIHTYILSFIDEDDYNNYMNNTQKPIETTGKIIEMMYFDETITIKKGYISVDDTIYTSDTDLSQYLLFGKNYELLSYKVKSGDTIASVSEANKLNPQEFLVANPKFTSVDSLLTVDEEVNITLINPILTFSYEVHEVADSKIPYETKVEYDNTKSSTYSLVTTPGVNGITRITSQSLVKNGETQSGVTITGSKEIVKKIDEVVVRGPSYSPITGQYVDTGTTWQWPTNQPYVITSGYGWRWGALHEAIDISGTGYGSPIYASAEGEVYASGVNQTCGWQGGECVVIAHANGYYTVYAHMVENSSMVKQGQKVSRGQVIGKMGTSGWVTGYHLHFGVYQGIPYAGGRSFNPLQLWR